MRYIWKTVSASLKKRILVVDEAWWLMQSEDGASFLFGLVKRARKYWLGVTTITQDVSDFMKSDYGKPIINNSPIKMLLKQSPAVINVVQETFGLTEEEKMILLEGIVGEGIFFAGKKHVAMRIMASYLEDQIVTTSPEKISQLKKQKQDYLG
jgi:conjugal transfer ATP-binding protein TraC